VGMKICDEDAVAEFFEGTIDDFEWCDETKQWLAMAPDGVQLPPPCLLRLNIVDCELGIRRKRRVREILHLGPGLQAGAILRER
jgi:hypothetical protein